MLMSGVADTTYCQQANHRFMPLSTVELAQELARAVSSMPRTLIVKYGFSVAALKVRRGKGAAILARIWQMRISVITYWKLASMAYSE